MKWCWKAQFILSAHIFIYWHRGSPKQRLKGRGLWNDNAHSSSSRQRHALLLARNVLTNCGRPQCHSPLLLYFFFFFFFASEGSCAKSFTLSPALRLLFILPKYIYCHCSLTRLVCLSWKEKSYLRSFRLIQVQEHRVQSSFFCVHHYIMTSLMCKNKNTCTQWCY